MGKGSSSTQLRDYYGTLAGVLCTGPIAGVCSIIVNGEEAWPRGIAWYIGLECVAGQLYVFDAQTWTCTTTHIATSANAPGSGLEGWTQYFYAKDTNDYHDFNCYNSQGYFIGTIRIYWGTETQAQDFYLQTANNDGGIKGNLGNGDNHPPYLGVCYAVVIDFLLGEEVQSGPNIEVVLRRVPDQTLITGSPAALTDGQANLAAVLVEVLTDENCLALPTSMIDDTSFQATANWLDGNSANYAASVLLDSAETLRGFLDKFLQMIDGWIRFNPQTQKIELGVYQHGVSPPTYANAVTVTADCLTKIPTFEATSWQGCYSRATVRYSSRQIDYAQTSVHADDPRGFFVLGTTRDLSLDRPWVTREGQALYHGRETLRVLGLPPMTGTLQVRREFGRAIRAGDFVFVNVELEPNGTSIYEYMRVKSRKIPPTGPIDIEVVADNTLAPVPFSTPYPTTTPGGAVPPPLAKVRAFLAPQTISGEYQAVCFLAERGDDLTSGCQVYFDTARVISASVTGITSDSTGNFGVITFSAAPGTVVGDAIDVSCSGNAAFNVSQAQVTAVNNTAKTITYALAAAMAPSTAGSGTITVADYYMTFSSIGVFTNFAAFATINTAINASAGTITLNVTTTQPDADLFTEQYTANDANNDTMLLILFNLVSSGADTGEIAESSGFAEIEICSVSTSTLVSAGVYQLSILRGRQGTPAASFGTANTEAWLIPRSVLAFFTNQNFGIITANRINGTVPAYAQFRFCPYNYTSQYPLSSAANVQFRFPLKSIEAPAITMTAPPGGGAISNGANALPYRYNLQGSVTDEESNLVEVKITAQAPSEANARSIGDWQFAPTGSYAFTQWISFDKPGTWEITITARDANGLITTLQITANISGTAKCALPDLYDAQGNVIPFTGVFTKTTASAANVVGVNTIFAPSAVAWTCAVAQYIPFGPFSFGCQTPGSQIQFATSGPYDLGGTLETPSATYAAGYNLWSTNDTPFHMLIDPKSVTISGDTVSGVIAATYSIYAYAVASGYANSDPVKWTLPLFV